MARTRWISREGPTHQGIVINDYTSLEVYLATGLVFLLGFTLSIVLTTIIHREPLVWLGWGLTLILTVVTFFGLRALEQRRRRNKTKARPKD